MFAQQKPGFRPSRPGGLLGRRQGNRVVVAVGLFLFVAIFYIWSSSGSRSRPSLLLDDVSNSTFGFEKVFVVGLPTRSDRRDSMTLLSSISNLEVEFIDGVRGQDVPDNAVPPHPDHERMADPVIGSWRAHMNAIREVVHRNLSSALILEDDVDWDVRIRHQLRDFALSAGALTQPLAANPRSFADPTFPDPAAPGPKNPDLSFQALPRTVAPQFSPYGDHWDVLWIGHCGMAFPPEGNNGIPQGRVIHANDETVPERRYLWTLNEPFTLKENYPEHTRAVHHSREGVCSLGYAISQRGARELLNEVGLRDVSDAFDLLLRYFCEGDKGRRKHLCLTVQPALIHHHRPAGLISAMSDIGSHGDGYREQSMTDMVRWSSRLNAGVLIDGGDVFWDQFPNADVVT